MPDDAVRAGRDKFMAITEGETECEVSSHLTEAAEANERACDYEGGSEKVGRCGGADEGYGCSRTVHRKKIAHMEGEGVRRVASGENREDFGGTHGPVQDLGVDR